jgi:hypothetical protein
MTSKPPTPKRGAFPTPKEVLDQAPQYIPDAPNSPDDQQGEETDPSSGPRRREDHKGGGKDEAKEPKRK